MVFNQNCTNPYSDTVVKGSNRSVPSEYTKPVKDYRMSSLLQVILEVAQTEMSKTFKIVQRNMNQEPTNEFRNYFFFVCLFVCMPFFSE